jgi:hypothetical protein
MARPLPSLLLRTEERAQMDAAANGSTSLRRPPPHRLSA